MFFLERFPQSKSRQTRLTAFTTWDGIMVQCQAACLHFLLGSLFPLKQAKLQLPLPQLTPHHSEASCATATSLDRLFRVPQAGLTHGEGRLLPPPALSHSDSPTDGSSHGLCQSCHILFAYSLTPRTFSKYKPQQPLPLWVCNTDIWTVQVRDIAASQSIWKKPWYDVRTAQSAQFMASFHHLPSCLVLIRARETQENLSS